MHWRCVNTIRGLLKMRICVLSIMSRSFVCIWYRRQGRLLDGRGQSQLDLSSLDEFGNNFLFTFASVRYDFELIVKQLFRVSFPM